MSEKSMFFNSTNDDERAYSAADMADVLSGLCPNGVIKGLTLMHGLRSGEIVLNTGKAMVNGYMYSLDTMKTFTVTDADLRYDRVVLRLDTVNRKITAEYKQGTDSERPELTQNSEIWEISLALINIMEGSYPLISADCDYARDYHNLVNTPIYSGTDEPWAGLGNNGDIYIQYEE